MSCQNPLLVFFVCALVPAAGLLADEGDIFHVNATLSTMRDNNLFRLAPGVDPRSFGLSGKSDTINTLGVGLNFNKTFGVQRLIANATMVDNRYQHNDYLNFRAFNFDAKWEWAYGKLWTGELFLDRSEALNSFSDFRNFQQRNVRTVSNQRLTGNYWFHTNWALVMGGSRTSLTNEQPFLAESDYDATGLNFGMRYRPAPNRTASLRVSRLEGEYAKRQFNNALQFDNGFTQTGYDLDYDWMLTGSTQVRGRLGYLTREHDRFSSRDYSGVVGNLDANYSYSAKGLLTLGYRRGLEAFQQLASSYYTLNEFTVANRWAVTSQVAAGARYAVGTRDYQGEIVALPAGIPLREDRFSRAGIDLSYQPASWVQLKAGVNLENRRVNLDNLDYKDRTTYISITAQY